MLVLFVLFMITIFRGYHRRRLEEMDEHDSGDDTPSASDPR